MLTKAWSLPDLCVLERFFRLGNILGWTKLPRSFPQSVRGVTLASKHARGLLFTANLVSASFERSRGGKCAYLGLKCSASSKTVAFFVPSHGEITATNSSVATLNEGVLDNTAAPRHRSLTTQRGQGVGSGYYITCFSRPGPQEQLRRHCSGPAPTHG